MNFALFRSSCAAVAMTLLMMLAAAPQGRAADAAKAALEVSIAIPLHNTMEERELSYHGTRPHFHVLVTNVSDDPQRVWREWCSWGYYSLSFEVTEADGKTRSIQKGPRAWTMNYPDYWIIPPHENLVLEVEFADTSVWAPFPHAKGEPVSFTMRAVFAIEADEQAKKAGVWTGRVVSKPVKCTAYEAR